MTALLPQPTVPGKTRGIIATDPLTIQCGDCGATKTRTTERTDALFIILARWLFCRCEPEPVRRCPECLAEHATHCERSP